jgi:hypothetical protein
MVFADVLTTGFVPINEINKLLPSGFTSELPPTVKYTVYRVFIVQAY